MRLITVDLPPPERPTSAVVLPASATKLDRVQHPLLRTIAEHDVAEFDPARRDLEVACAGRVLLEFAGVEEIVEHADAEQGRRQVDVEPRHALHRLVKHDDRGDEREQAAGLVAANNDGVTAVEHDRRDGEAAEALHDRARARAHRGELVGGASGSCGSRRPAGRA